MPKKLKTKLYFEFDDQEDFFAFEMPLNETPKKKPNIKIEEGKFKRRKPDPSTKLF